MSGNILEQIQTFRMDNLFMVKTIVAILFAQSKYCVRAVVCQRSSRRESFKR